MILEGQSLWKHQEIWILMKDWTKSIFFSLFWVALKLWIFKVLIKLFSFELDDPLGLVAKEKEVYGK